jgi:hypothetical protein
LAEISKLSGVAIANVAKVDAILKASIANINDLTIPSAGPGAPLAAYSVRLLDSAVGVSSYTGPAMRVRRDTGGGSGDDDEADISFDSGVISLDSAISNASSGVTATTLGQFINVGTVGGTTYTNPDSLTVTASCYVDEWKDQSGNLNHATQSSVGSQPQIHDGTADTDLNAEGVDPTLTFGNSQYMAGPTSLSTIPVSVFAVSRKTATGNANIWGLGAAFNDAYLGIEHDQYSTAFRTYYGLTSGFSSIETAITEDEYSLRTVVTNTGSIKHFKNGTELDSATNIANKTGVGLFIHSRLYATTNIQELLYYDADKSDDQSSIESDINSEYLIYQPTDAPTSGLLATYTGAAAAYSVRQLSDKAVIAMRIRRDSDDAETNIGFDSNGDLDTTAISDFCSTANGYVVEWADQSTNGNHASQSTSGSQPQIYNGSSVISKQGEPCVYFGVSSSANLSAGNIWTDASGPVSGFAVMNIDTTQTGGFLGRWLHMEAQAFHYVDTQWRFLDSAQASLSTPSPAIDTDYLVTFFHKVNQVSGQDAVQGAVNGGTFADAKPANRTLDELRLGGGIYNLDANLKEVVVWNSGQNTNRSGIETNINNYFSIY